MPNIHISDSLSEKWKFLDKYEKISKFIRPNTPCYAIAADWWVNFECLATIAQTESDMPMGNPGPINNLSILNLSKMYKDLIQSNEQGGRSDSIPHHVLSEMDDWDNMSLKPELRYREEFVIVNQSMWKFLHEQFGGGPEIEFIPESKPKNPSRIPGNAITYQDEPYLSDEIIINLDLIKVYISKGYDFDCAMPRYISPSITAHNLLSQLSGAGYFNKILYLKTKQNDLLEFESNNIQLADKGVQNGSYLMYLEDTTSRIKNNNQEREEEIASSKDVYGPKPDSQYDYNHVDNDAFQYATDHNEYSKQNDIEMKDFKSESKNGVQTESNMNGLLSKNQEELDAFRQLSKKAAEKEKLKLGFKTLDQIKNNLNNLQEDWNSYANTNHQR